jgi:hypothetical protein
MQEHAVGPWRAELRTLADARGTAIILREGNAPARFDAVLLEWIRAPQSGAAFGAILAGLPYAALRWECPVLTQDDLSRPFQCVAIDDPRLDTVQPDAAAFAEHFDRAAPGARVTRLENLGRNAVLVVPLPMGGASVYPHLATFVRGAGAAQVGEFFSVMAEEALRLAALRKLWMSTAGGGVSWLHGRLDSSPKYYSYGPFRAAASLG